MKNTVVNLTLTVSITATVVSFLFLVGTYVSVKAHSDERKIRIAILDTGVGVNREISRFLCDSGYQDLTGEGIRDMEGHGTNIAGLITKDLDPDKYCIIIIKWWHTKKVHFNTLAPAIMRAVIDKADYINMSLTGPVSIPEEMEAINRALILGIKVVVAAGNEGTDLGLICDTYPACYPIIHKNFYIVENINDNGVRYNGSNYGGPVNAYAKGVGVTAGGYTMTGTSQATAVFLNSLLKN